MAEVVGGLAGTLQGSATGLLNKGQGFIDKWFPPEKRASWSASIKKFMTEKPMLASFLLSHIAISGFPLALFCIMTLTVGIFALVAAILVGLLGALVFIVFCVGIALIILLPTLFFTTLTATFVWLWGVGAYFLLKWFNQEKIPGIHTTLGEGAKGLLGGEGEGEGSSENEKLDALNPPAGAANGSPDHPRGGSSSEANRDDSTSFDNNNNNNNAGKEGRGSGGKTTKGKDGSGDPMETVGKTTGVDTGAVGGEVKNKAGRATGSLEKGIDTSMATKALPVG